MPIPQLWGTWLLHTCDMTPRYVWHTCEVTSLYTPDAPFMPQLWGTWLLHTCDMTHPMCYMTHHMCDMTHTYVWSDVDFTQGSEHVFVYTGRAIYAIDVGDVTPSYVWHDSLLRVPCAVECDMTYSTMLDSLWLRAWYVRATWLIYMCDMTYSNMSDSLYLCDTCVWHN